jgi:hypothetical protein
MSSIATAKKQQKEEKKKSKEMHIKVTKEMETLVSYLWLSSNECQEQPDVAPQLETRVSIIVNAASMLMKTYEYRLALHKTCLHEVIANYELHLAAIQVYLNCPEAYIASFIIWSILDNSD